MEFSKEGYLNFIKFALDSGYQLTTSFKANQVLEKTHLVGILRHDVDYSLLTALQLAKLESKNDIKATYYILPYNDFYNPLSPNGRSLVRQIAELGHEIGLHWYAPHYQFDKGEMFLKNDIELLSEIANQKVVSLSQHEPSITGNFQLPKKYQENDAYSVKFKDFVYVSDSSMTWRQYTPLDLINKKVSFQFLSHPAHWIIGGKSRQEVYKGCFELQVDQLKKSYRDWDQVVSKALIKRKQLDQNFKIKSKKLNES